MTKIDIVDNVCEKVGYSKKEVAKIVIGAYRISLMDHELISVPTLRQAQPI